MILSANRGPPHVPGLIHVPHPAATQLGDDLVVVEAPSASRPSFRPWVAAGHVKAKPEASSVDGRVLGSNASRLDSIDGVLPQISVAPPRTSSVP